MNPPICKKCRNSTIQADAGLMGNSIKYWYCRSCKIEVDDLGYDVMAKKESIDVDNQSVNPVSIFDDGGAIPLSSKPDWLYAVKIDRTTFEKEYLNLTFKT